VKKKSLPTIHNLKQAFIICAAQFHTTCMVQKTPLKQEFSLKWFLWLAMPSGTQKKEKQSSLEQSYVDNL
jgi:hypothetical protein